MSPTQAPRKGPAWWHRYLEMADQVFLVLVRLPDDVPPDSDLVVPHHVSPHITHGHRPITRTTQTQSLRDVGRRPGHSRVIRSENGSDHNGRRLSALAGLRPRRSPVPSRPPFVPSHPEP